MYLGCLKFLALTSDSFSVPTVDLRHGPGTVCTGIILTPILSTVVVSELSLIVTSEKHEGLN